MGVSGGGGGGVVVVVVAAAGEMDIAAPLFAKAASLFVDIVQLYHIDFGPQLESPGAMGLSCIVASERLPYSDKKVRVWLLTLEQAIANCPVMIMRKIKPRKI